MRGTSAVAVVLVSVVALGACGESGDATTESTATTATTATTLPAVEVDAFASWYRDAVAEGGDSLDPRFDASDPASTEAFAGLVRTLCAVSADTPEQRQASGEAIKNDPEWFGDASFARSGIIMARTACGLD